jgi:hypothetical protein
MGIKPNKCEAAERRGVWGFAPSKKRNILFAKNPRTNWQKVYLFDTPS